MNAIAHDLFARLAQSTPEEQELVLRFLVGKRTAAQGRSNPQLDLFLATLQMELPGAMEILGDWRFALGEDLHAQVAQWAQDRSTTAVAYGRALARFRELFL